MGILENAKPENCFYCADGSVLHNISELRQKLKTISPQAFCHHVSQSKNDFHNWIRDVFQDYELANDILKAKTPAAAAATVDRHLKRALLAKEEIEKAISKIIKAQARAITSAPPAKAKPKSSKDDWAQSQIGIRPIAQSAQRRLATESRLGKPKRKLKPKKRRRPQKQRKLKHPQKIQRAEGKKKNARQNKKLNKKQNASKQKAVGRSRAEKRGKKRVNMWLKWLKLVPEL